MPESSNLVIHATREMKLLGVEDDVQEAVLKIVRIFADMGHSGSSAMFVIPMINDLLSFRNLSDLTNDPKEWMHISEEQWGSPGGIWQSMRNSEAFSNDSGNTYYLLSEGGSDQHREPLHTSKVVV